MSRKNPFKSKQLLNRQLGLDWIFDVTPSIAPLSGEEGGPLAVESESDSDLQKNDLGHDLMHSINMVEKVCNDIAYAQNLYAALCNTEWCKKDVVSILKEEYWSCSWRAAGGIVADMRQTGDYIDWYCSGISVFVDMDDTTFDSLTKDQLETYHTIKRYVQEGVITDEVRGDLLELGWIPVDYNQNM